MPKVIDGIVYRHVPAALVVDSAGDPQENLPGGQVYATSDGAPLAIAEYPSGAGLASIQTSSYGLIPDLYVAFPVNASPEGYIDWPGDGIPAQPISASAAELTDWIRATVVGEVDALVQSNSLLEARVIAAEERVDAAIASIPDSTGGTGGTGKAGLFEVSHNGTAWEFTTLAAAVAAGMQDSDRAWFIGPIDVDPQPLPPAWRRATDLWSRPEVSTT